MVRAVEGRDLDVDHRVTRDHARIDRFLDAFVDRRDELARHGAADDRIDEFIALAGLVGLELEPDMPVLATAARLAHELAFGLDRTAQRLAVGDLRLADIGVDLELALHAIDDDLEVQFTHPGDDRLAGFLVSVHAERRVFLGEALQRDAHLLLIDLGLRLDSDGDDGVREHHLLEGDRFVFGTEGVTGGDILEADSGRDVAGADFFDLGALRRMHLQQATDALVARLGRHIDRVAGVEHPGVDAEEGQVADEGVVEDLEGERGERRLVPAFARGGVTGVVDALHGRQLRRRGHEIDDGVEQRLHALVLEGGSAHAEHDVVAQRALAQPALDLGHRELFAAQVLVHQRIVGLGGGLDHLRAQRRSLGLQGLRDLAVLEVHALGGHVPIDRLHVKEVDHAFEIVLCTDRQLDGHRVTAQAGLDLLDAAQEICAGTVHLVDERDPRHAVAVHLPPHRLGLRLDPRHGAEERDRGVKHAQ